jgi:plastocyanin
MFPKQLLLAALAAPLALALAQYDYSTPSANAAPSASATSSGAAPTISVGAGGLTFSPDSVTVPMGGQVVFSFAAFSEGHSATQADFTGPCAPAAMAGFNSGFVTKGGQTFVVNVTSADPMWFYCGQVSHCQGGMVGVINPPASGQTLDQFKSAAAGTSKSSLPASVQGGTLGASASSGGSTSGTTSAAQTSSTAKSGAGMLVPGGALFLGGLFAALMR